ncbi:MAG TPA: response regulator [Candidatus Sulfotelmatobacter sp.]|nr:response regulator [Candidatus Sulfotelmatobacter sp.]
MKNSAEEKNAGTRMAETTGILLVDDEIRNLDVLESILGNMDLRFVRATSPEEALLALVHGEFACIVLDIHMPGMSGLELARLIKTRKRNQSIPIIFLTAYFLDEKDILEGYGVGAVDYLTKPINPQILKSKVGVFVDLFRTTHALALANNALEAEIAQRKQAEEALRVINKDLESTGQKMKWQLASIVESSDDAIISKDINGIINSWNRGAELLFGYGAAEVLGKPISILIPPERLDEEPEILGRIRKGMSIDHYETIRRHKDGRLLNISLTVSPMKDVAGNIIGASKIARDITVSKQAEAELKRANDEIAAALRAKDDFLATLSHELRTPLNPVLLIASEAANDRELPPRTRMDFAAIRKNVELEARLIDDLLDLTRIARGKIILEKNSLDIFQVLEDAIDNLQEEFDNKQIGLNSKLDSTRHTVFGDAARLQQIFLNLLKNAVKFTPAGGKITITSSHEADRLAIKITDTGIGLLPGETASIFTAFTQGSHAQSGKTHQFGGLGLGLAIAQKLAELHSGKIYATSEGRNQGSTFVVELPLAPAAKNDEIDDPDTATPLPDAPSGKGIHILLVEDHGPTRTTLAHLLERRRYTVVTAASISEALAIADKRSFNLLISDIGLPDGNGYDLMEELGKRFALQGIALTGYGMEQDIARSQKAGFVSHLTKPVRMESLDKALATLLNQKPVVSNKA